MFETLGVKCEKGSKARGRYVLGELADGSPVTLAVRIVCGAKEGPTVSLTGMLHGDEYNGLAAINRVLDEVDPAQLSGILIGFPMANPFAVITKSRVTALDYERLNGNRVFPGNANGLIVERMSAAVFEGGIRKANYHLDFHEGGYDFIAKYLITRQIPGDERVSRENLRLARAFGMGIPVNVSHITPQARSLGRAGSSTIQSSLIGIPSLTSELGGGGRLWPEYVDLGVKGTTNVLKELGMLPGDRVGVDQKQLFGSPSQWPRPNRGGIWDQRVDLGQVVAEGQTVGYVRNAFGEVVEELKAPFRSVIFDIRNTAAIMSGEWTVHCGKLE